MASQIRFPRLHSRNRHSLNVPLRYTKVCPTYCEEYCARPSFHFLMSARKSGSENFKGSKAFVDMALANGITNKTHVVYQCCEILNSQAVRGLNCENMLTSIRLNTINVLHDNLGSIWIFYEQSTGSRHYYPIRFKLYTGGLCTGALYTD